MTENNPKPAPGQWWTMQYGFEFSEWLILEVTKNRVKLAAPGWLVSAAKWFSLDHFMKTADYIKTGKKKWYWRFLPWKDFVMPYTK